MAGEAPTSLFERFVVIGLKRESDTSEPVTECLHHFAADAEEREEEGKAVVAAVQPFCFPDAAEQEATFSHPREVFSFVLTRDTGDRFFGVCQRVLGSGKGERFPVCLCIITQRPWFSFFAQVLSAVLDVRAQSRSLDAVDELLRALRDHRDWPAPGGTLRVPVKHDEILGGQMECVLTRPRETGSEWQNVNYLPLFKRLGPHQLIFLFKSILLENRIVFLSNSLPLLSSCTIAAVAWLQPFVWQHILMPVTPPSLLTYACAPMPFVMGVQSAHVDQLKALPLERTVFVHLDKMRVEVLGASQDDITLPRHMQRVLSRGLRSVMAGDRKKARYFDNARVSRLFINFFLYALQGYTDYVTADASEVSGGHDSPHSASSVHVEWFARDDFLASKPDEERAVLEAMTHTQMFEVFVTASVRGELRGSVFEELMDEWITRHGARRLPLHSLASRLRQTSDVLKHTGGRIRNRLSMASKQLQRAMSDAVSPQPHAKTTQQAQHQQAQEAQAAQPQPAQPPALPRRRKSSGAPPPLPSKAAVPAPSVSGENAKLFSMLAMHDIHHAPPPQQQQPHGQEQVPPALPPRRKSSGAPPPLPPKRRTSDAPPPLPPRKGSDAPPPPLPAPLLQAEDAAPAPVADAFEVFDDSDSSAWGDDDAGDWVAFPDSGGSADTHVNPFELPSPMKRSTPDKLDELFASAATAPPPPPPKSPVRVPAVRTPPGINDDTIDLLDLSTSPPRAGAPPPLPPKKASPRGGLHLPHVHMPHVHMPSLHVPHPHMPNLHVPQALSDLFHKSSSSVTAGTSSNPSTPPAHATRSRSAATTPPAHGAMLDVFGLPSTPHTAQPPTQPHPLFAMDPSTPVPAPPPRPLGGHGGTTVQLLTGADPFDPLAAPTAQPVSAPRTLAKDDDMLLF